MASGRPPGCVPAQLELRAGAHGWSTGITNISGAWIDPAFWIIRLCGVHSAAEAQAKARRLPTRLADWARGD
jgi:hypothetical protein